MTTLVSDIITPVRTLLLDPSPGDWFTDAALLPLISLAQTKILLVRPELNPTVETLALVAGTVQSLSASGIALLDIYTNVASKRAAIETSRSQLDNPTPLWPAATPQAEVLHWMHDARVKTMYRVYPPNDGTGQLLALVCRLPAPVTATGDAVSVNDLYAPVLVYLTLAECYGANSVKRDVEKASYYTNQAMTLLGVNTQAGLGLAPKLGSPGGS